MTNSKAFCKICGVEFGYSNNNKAGLFCSRGCYNKWTNTPEGKKQASAKAIGQSHMKNQPNTQKLSDEELIKLWERFKEGNESMNSLFGKSGYKRVPLKKLVKLIGKEEYNKYKIKNAFKNRSYLYKRGVHYERKALHELKKEGYIVVRSSHSLGVFDLWALKDKLRLIQVKSTKTHSNFTKLKGELEKIIIPNFCSKELWVWNDRKGWNKTILK